MIPVSKKIYNPCLSNLWYLHGIKQICIRVSVFPNILITFEYIFIKYFLFFIDENTESKQTQAAVWLDIS